MMNFLTRGILNQMMTNDTKVNSTLQQVDTYMYGSHPQEGNYNVISLEFEILSIDRFLLKEKRGMNLGREFSLTGSCVLQPEK